MPEMRVVSPTEIIGQKLVEIRQSWKMDPEQSLDFAWNYFLLDAGLVVALRCEMLVTETMPRDAEPIIHRFLAKVYGQHITKILLADDSYPGHIAPFLVLANGWLVSDVAVDIHGVDGVGVLFFEPGELNTSGFRSL